MQNQIKDLIALNARIKLEAEKGVGQFKGKYEDYKNKLKKANQNIQTLATRVAKYEIQMQAEREDRGSARQGEERNYSSQGYEEDQFNFAKIAQNMGLNEEIRNLLDQGH